LARDAFDDAELIRLISLPLFTGCLAAGVAQRTRDRILGHASAVPGRYSRKSKIDPEQIAAIEKLEPPVVKTMREVLMGAKEKTDRGELIILKPWIRATT